MTQFKLKGLFVPMSCMEQPILLSVRHSSRICSGFAKVSVNVKVWL